MFQRLFLLLGCFMPVLALAAEAPQPMPDVVVAKRGGAVVTLADVDAKVSGLPPEARARFLDSPQRIEATVSNLLLIKQLAAEAREAGLEKDASIAAQIRYANDQILAGARVKQLADKAPKFDAAALAKENYLADPARFKAPDSVIARHVLIRVGENRDDASAKALAEKIRADAIAGKPLAALATQYSDDDGSKAEGGLLPEFTPGRMQKPFEEAAFALQKPGAISPVVKTKFGYHVIELVAHKPGQPRSFEQAKDELTKRLTDEHMQRYRKEHMDQLQSMAIEADAKVVESLRTRYSGAAAPEVVPESATGEASDASN